MHSHNPRGTIAPVALALACWLATIGCGPSVPVPSSPHPIIIVDIDTLRADHLGCYGYDRETSPSIDAFAHQSLFFERAFSQAPNTPPSQASILTGLYPSSHGMIYDDDRVSEEIVTLAEALAEQGYATAGFHDGGYLRGVFGIGQGFQLYDDNRGGGLASVGPKAIQWMRQHAHQNFLLFIHTYDTHTPYAPVPPYDRMFMEGVPDPTPGFEPTTDRMEQIRLSKYTDTLLTLPANDLAYAMALYDGEIRYVDQWFAEFWSAVDELGLDERATIVFLSDHGEEFQEHGSVLHEKLYATVTHIPFMIRLPRGQMARAVPEIVETVDLMPTLLDLTGIPIPSDVQGESLVPLILGEDTRPAHTAISESPFFGHRRAVALGDHHMLFTKKTGESELYDLPKDPLEQDDIVDEHPNTAAVMRGLLESWEHRVGLLKPDRTADQEPLDEETLEQLRELGYVQ
jgi:arylsulfatase A-like enzyme